MKPKLVAILIAAALVLIILFQNVGSVTFRIFFWSVQISQLLLVLLMLLVGFAFGFLTAKLTGKKRRN